MERPRIIALYLPQYHPFPENDEWWGKGFTEWRSVVRAKPLFKGHYQPKIPADLGFYDLRLPIVREQQAELAREAGVEGFCYWHYWFGDGKQLMADIFNDVLKSGSPQFPFCLGWANHSWYAKNWNTKDSGIVDKLLMEQKFPGDEDVRKHYEYVLKAFKDPRYIKIGNKPFFMIYISDNIPDNFISSWNKWAIDDGFDGIFFVGNVNAKKSAAEYVSKGFSAVIKNRIQAQIDKNSIRKRITASTLWGLVKAYIFKYPKHIYKYEDCINDYIDKEDDLREDVIPCLIPNFDHSPRSNQYGYIVDGSTPTLFEKYAEKVLSLVKEKENKIIILRSWNEWGEGNYMEPDLRWGKGYIESLYKAIIKIFGKDTPC